MGEGSWELAFAYRYQESERHFIGDKEDRDRQSDGTEEINTIHLMDFGLTYAFTKRVSMTISLPVLVADRSEPIQDAQERVVGRNFSSTVGIGDLSTVGRLWLLDPDTHSTGNVSLGLGAKFPTGRDGVKDDFISANGVVTRRAVDQSIQPGDGGYGAIVELRGFSALTDYLTLFAQGTYLFNPRNTNGVETGRGRPSESEMSVSDQFLGRIGAAVPLFPEDGLSFALAARVEGVPVRDLIGESDGFRRPGIAVSVEPSLIYSRGAHNFSVSVPVAVYRNRWKSVPDKKDGTHGDAAFADYLILVNYAYRFGGTEATQEHPEEVPESRTGSIFDDL